MRLASRLAALASALWAGVLACIGAMAAPSAFATLAVPDAGRFVGRLFAQEAYLSLTLALLLFLVERQRSRDAAQAGTGSVFSVNIMLIFGTLFCTVAGYFAVQPMIESARRGEGGPSFAVLHGVASAFFLAKVGAAAALAWRLTARRAVATPAAPTS